MYEKLGRMMGRSYEETLQILVKTIKNTESQMRIEIICTLEKVLTSEFDKRLCRLLYL